MGPMKVSKIDTDETYKIWLQKAADKIDFDNIKHCKSVIHF
jgi:hypothetical protein